MPAGKPARPEGCSQGAGGDVLGDALRASPMPAGKTARPEGVALSNVCRPGGRRLSYDTRLDCIGQSGAVILASEDNGRQGRSVRRLVFGTVGSRLGLAIFQTSCMDTRA